MDALDKPGGHIKSYETFLDWFDRQGQLLLEVS